MMKNVRISCAGRFRCGIKQAVQMHDEVAHLGVVDGFARLAKPGLVRLGVVRKKSDHIQLREILEINILDVMELAAKDEMNQLFWKQRIFSQGLFMVSLLAQVPAMVNPSTRQVGAFVDDLKMRSLAGSSVMNMSFKFPAMVISLTGNASCPFSIQNPDAPRL